LTVSYLLDTNVLSEPIKSHPDLRVVQAIAEHDGELATCSIVWHELCYGVTRLVASAKRRAIETYLEEAVRAALPILPYDEAAAAWHARECARLVRRGRSPSAADGQVAAIASVNELTLVTANTRDFRQFEGLDIEDWSR
jgi:tRNA(fMet)-specific endonuclease VapC